MYGSISLYYTFKLYKVVVDES